MADDPLVNATPTNEPGPGPGKGTVSALMIVVLAFYLVILTGLLLWGIYWKWPPCGVGCVNQTASSGSPTTTPSATPSSTTSSATPASTTTPTRTPPSSTTSPSTPPSTTTPSTATSSSTTPPTANTIGIDSLSPKTGLVNCSTQITIKGKGFKPGASVIFGGVLANAATVDPSGQYISVQSPAHAEGDVDLVVKNLDGASSDIAKAAYTYSCPPASDSDLFLLVVFAGALGGALHGLRSLSWYVGLRSLVKSWTLMYVLLPFTGATIAVIFYAVIRAGLLPVQANKNTSVVLIAIAVLVGLFSQQAAVKLKDIANAFLAKPSAGPPSETKPQGSLPPGGGPVTKPGTSAPAPAISPASGPAGTPVKITGTGMTTVTSITFGGVAGTAIAVAPDGTITVTPPAPAAGQVDPVEVVVSGDKGAVKLSFTYKP